MTTPIFIDGYGPARPFAGAWFSTAVATRAGALIRPRRPGDVKRLASITEAILASGLSDGGTISFHHHLRDGDDVVRLVVEAIAALGIRDLHLAASSLFPVHQHLVEHIRSGVITKISAAYIAGPVAKAISAGELRRPAVLQTHGGRARAITSGELEIDVAFIAAPTADDQGNLNGVDGPSACGVLGYAMVDARHANCVVAITDHLVEFPAASIDIPADEVDYIVCVHSIGDPSRIVSGTTRVTEDATGLAVAAMTARVIEASGLLKGGLSFQTGAGGISLAVADALAVRMRERGVVGSFASGGITGAIVSMFREGLFRALFDVQCFDLEAVASYREDAGHLAMSASLYANPSSKAAIVNALDVMILGAAEVDLDFNVNVTAVGGGAIIGGSGGHADTAAGAKLAIVTTRLTSGKNAKIVDRVECRTTPGESIDVVVTEGGIAINPARGDLTAALVAADLPVVPIQTLRDLAALRAGPPVVRDLDPTRRIVAVVEYRDGTVIDVVRRRAS